MKTIWKYPLVITGEQRIEVPKGSKFLSVIEQEGHPVLYFLVDTEAPKVPTDILICGTGQPFLEFLDRSLYLGTVSTREFVWHIYTKWDY